jgi:hypothetical protein
MLDGVNSEFERDRIIGTRDVATEFQKCVRQIRNYWLRGLQCTISMASVFL